MEILNTIIPLLVSIALLWFTYNILSLAYTIIKARKEDNSLEFCLSSLGKAYYITLIIVYLVCFFGFGGYIIINIINDNWSVIYFPLNALTVISLGLGFLFQQVILIGHRQMMIGKVKLDYRKIKRVTYPSSTKLRFVYGQKSYQTSIRFADDFEVKKALQRSR